MSTVLLKNISLLVNVREETTLIRGKDLAHLPAISNAWLLIEDDLIACYGSMNDLPREYQTISDSHDLTGRLVLPAWCDSHTHLVFAKTREEEFVDKLKGLSYLEIAAKGGGILNSASKVAEAREDALFSSAWERLQVISRLGTGAVEIKSGYGLTPDAEIKMLRVIKRLKQKSKLLIKSTFLGAHAYPKEFRNNHEGYIRQITTEMLPQIAAEGLADYVDVFCEENFFSVAEMEVICQAAKLFGLKPKLHVNQMTSMGGVEAGVKLGAVSVDHLEHMDKHAVQALAKAETIGTILPSASFFLRMQYAPARELIDGGAAIALASDFNPGSSPSGNMNFVLSLACIQLKMLPEEAINAATVNGAFAMEIENNAGSISKGKRANLIITRPVPSIAYLPYAFGENWIESVMIAGEFI